MDKETRRRMIALIDEGMDEARGGNVVMAPRFGNMQKWGRDAVFYLEDLGALRRSGDYRGWAITAHAPEVRRRLSHPRLTWT